MSIEIVDETKVKEADLYSYPFFRTENQQWGNLPGAINLYSQGLCVLRNWIDSFGKDVIDVEKAALIAKDYSSILGLRQSLADFAFLVQEESIDSNRELACDLKMRVGGFTKEILDRSGKRWVMPDEGRLQEPKDEKQLVLLNFLASGFLHDMGNVVSKLLCSQLIPLNLRVADNLRIINTAFDDLEENLMEAEASFLKPITVEPIKLTEISEIFENELYEHLKDYASEVVFICPEAHLMEGITVVASHYWLKHLAKNILSNMKKIFKDCPPPFNAGVSFGHMWMDEKSFVEILIDNNGPEFDPEIIEKGFQKGLSGFKKAGKKGTGFGMNLHAMVFKENFGGIIIPTNRPEGGVRLIIRLPVVN